MKTRRVMILCLFWLLLGINNICRAGLVDQVKLTSCAVLSGSAAGMCYANWADLWSPEKWSTMVSPDKRDSDSAQPTISSAYWSPHFVGYRNHNNKKVVIKFMISESEHNFYATNFNGTTTRIPVALEFDIVDRDNKLGQIKVIDYTAKSNLPGAAGLFIDSPVSDNVKQLSVVVPRPDVLVPGEMYEIEFYPNNPEVGNAIIHANIQLSMNYKWLGYMHDYNQLSSHYELTDMYQAINRIVSDDNFNPKTYIQDSRFGNNIDPLSFNGWSYYLMAETDGFNSVNVVANNNLDFACSDKGKNIEHDKSGYQWCGFDPLKGLDLFFKFDHAFSSDLWAGVSSSTVYYLSNGKRYPIFDEEMYRAMGNINTDGSTNWSKVSTITGYLAEYVSSEFPIGKTLNLNGLVAKFPSKGEFATYRLMFGQWYRTREIKSDAILLSDEILKTYPISLYIYEDKFWSQQSIFLSQSSVSEITAQLAVATTEDNQIEGSTSDLIEVETSNQEIPEEIAQWYQDNQTLTSSNPTYASPYNLSASALSSVSVKANWNCPANASSCIISLVNKQTNEVIGPYSITNATSEDKAQTFIFSSDSRLFGNTDYETVIKAQYLVTVGSIQEVRWSNEVRGVFVTTLSPASIAGNPINMILCDEQSNFTCMNEKNSFKYTPGHVYLEVKLENLYADTLYMKPRLYAPNSNVNLTADFGAYGRFDGNINNQWHTFFDFTELVQQTENQTGIWKIELYCGNTISTINLFCGEVNFVIGERSFSLPLPPMGLKSTIIGL